jgi:hypothetical protein
MQLEEMLHFFSTSRGELEAFHEAFGHADDQHTDDQDAAEELDASEWQALAREYDPRLRDIMVDNGWIDFYLIHLDGHIVYSVQRGSDLGQNILESELKDTSMGWAFEMAQGLGAEEVAVGDFAPYGPAQAGGRDNHPDVIAGL